MQAPTPQPPPSLLRVASFWLLAAVLPCTAQAADGLVQLVETTAQVHASGLAGRVQVKAVQPAKVLPGCSRTEAFMPPGSKPSGEVLVGVRCAAGASWTRFVPVQINVTVRHAVTQQALPAGHKIAPTDVQWVEAELARLPRDVVLEETQLAGTVALQALAAGAPVRRDLLKAQPVVLQGHMVKVTTLGAGFSLSAEGKAQTNAAPGQALQVRLPGGQVITAVARADGSAEKRL